MQSEDLVKKAHDASLQLIFYHNSAGNVMFERNPKELYFCKSTPKFSLLGSLNDNFKYGGYFEFLIEYPEDNNYIQWKHKKNPLETNVYEKIISIHVHAKSSDI